MEYVAAAALTAAGCVIGRGRGIQPKRHDTWLVVPNLWGALVGVPGEKKSPALKEALAPLFHLEEQAREQRSLEQRGYEAEVEIYRAQRDAVIKRVKSKGAATPPL